MRADGRLLLLALVTAFAFSVAPARAVTVGFECLTNDDPGDCAVGEGQLSVDVTDQGGGIVRFHFKNAGPAASVLSEVHFDDGSLLALSSVIDGSGVDFEPDASPPDLPGGETAVPPFEATEGFLVASPATNGAGPSEWVAIEFTLQGGQTFADVISELGTGELRIGIHVIGFASGGSESFVNPAIPEPSTGLLPGAGLLGVAFLRRGRGVRL